MAAYRDTANGTQQEPGAIEVSLASSIFRELGADAEGLLGIIAFFPQGVDEKNLEWLFLTIPNGPSIFNKFCILSLTYRSNGFFTSLCWHQFEIAFVPWIRRHPRSSTWPRNVTSRGCQLLSTRIPRLCRSSADHAISGDVNIECLLDVFTLIDADSENVWDACADSVDHLYWKKPQFVKIEALPDDYPSKPRCLKELSWLFCSIGNQATPHSSAGLIFVSRCSDPGSPI